MSRDVPETSGQPGKKKRILAAMTATAAELQADVARLQEVQQVLRESEERYTLAMQGTNEGLWDWDVEHGEIYFSARFKEMLGYGEDELDDVVTTWQDRLHPDDRDHALQTLRRHLQGEGPFLLEHRLRHRDGSYRWVRARGVSQRDDAGRATRMAGSIADVTEERRTAEALRDSEVLYHSLVENLPLIIFRKDAEGRYTFISRPSAAGLFQGGAPNEQVLGKTDADLFPAPLAEQHRRDDLRVMATGETVDAIERLRGTAGEPLYMEVKKSPLLDARGQVIGIQGIGLDVTARKRSQEELQRAKEAAEAATQARSAFLANMSHEIRTPMNAIIGMTELALDTKLTTDQRDYLTSVKNAADALLSLLNDILDFSKIEAGRFDLEEIDFSLRGTVGETLRTLAVRAHSKGLELAGHVLPDVPDALIGDPGRLRQVMVNLVGNAIKFTDHGEVIVSVAEEWRQGGEIGLHFSVSDTGIGIDPRKQQVILEPFAQADASTTRRYGGTGLGLTIAGQFAALMGGRLWVDSTPGQGSTFHFTVRLGLGAERDSPALAAVPASLEGTRVLVVDDNATIRLILSEILAGWGMRPTPVRSGKAALKAVKRAAGKGRPFALVLLDAVMPGLGGADVAAKLARRSGAVGPVVLMVTSADRRPGAKQRRKLGLAAHLVKPIREFDLFDVVMTALHGADWQSDWRTDGGHEPDAGSAGGGEDTPERRPLRILLAEDNAVNQRLARKVLERWGHAVEVVETGTAAVAAVEAGAFDLVLMDMQMPEMDGFDAVVAIRAAERDPARAGGAVRHIPIVAMTAHAMKGDRERCLAAGTDGYVAKPFRQVELRAAIDDVTPDRGSSGHPGSEAPVVSESSILERVGGDRQLLSDIINDFVTHTPALVAALRTAAEAGDADGVSRAAHTIKGSAANFGPSALVDAATRLEQEGRAGHTADARPRVAELEVELGRFQAALLALQNA